MEEQKDINQEFGLVVKNASVRPDMAERIRSTFGKFVNRVSEIKDKVDGIIVTDASQTDLMEMARTGRLEVAKVRFAAEKEKTRLKRDSLMEGRAYQEAYNLVESVCKPLEEHLLKQEKFEYLQLKESRLEEIRPFLEFMPANLDYGNMLEADYVRLLDGAKAQKAAQEESERRAAQAKEALKRQYELSRERMNALKEDWQHVPQEYREAELGTFSDAEWQALQKSVQDRKAAWERNQEEIAKRNEELEKKRQEEKEESDRKEKEAANKMAALQKEKEEADRLLAAELARKEEVRRREAADARKKKREERKLRTAPDKEKLENLIDQIEKVSIPTIVDPEMDIIRQGAATMLQEASNYIRIKLQEQE